jgi:hypothetical protein
VPRIARKRFSPLCDVDTVLRVLIKPCVLGFFFFWGGGVLHCGIIVCIPAKIFAGRKIMKLRGAVRVGNGVPGPEK